MPLPRDAQTQLEAIVVHFLGQTKAKIGNRFETAVTPASGEGANWEGQGVNDLHLIGCLTTDGALSLETIEAKLIFDGDQIRDLEVEKKNRAKESVEELMIATNGVTARYLAAEKFPSIQRVVRTSKRWDLIVTLAQDHGSKLPANPDSVALDAFLIKAKVADPLRFPDLSLPVIKLLGAGEYIAERPDDTTPDHFGLAVKDYAHSTAPNRRYTDLITQRLFKDAIACR